MRNTLAAPRRSKSTRWAALTLAALAFPTILRAQEPTNPPATASKDPIVAELIEAHNKERTKEGLPPLKFESKLEEAAKAHAKDMADREVMSHEGADGSTPTQRVVNAGYHYLHAGENVARGYRDVPKVMQMWMESPPHKKNVMGDYTEIGAARVESKEGASYWCVEFGKPIPKFNPDEAASDLARRINDERVLAKLPVLAIDPKLAKFAQDQAATLAKKKNQGGGTASFDGLDTNLYPDLAMSTAVGQPDAETVFKGLKEGGELKSKILGKYARIGVGYATAEDGTPFWCLILANPKRR